MTCAMPTATPPPARESKYASYEDAYASAQAYADYYDTELLLEASYAYAGAPKGSAWIVRHAPLERNRYGCDARAEVVRPMGGTKPSVTP